MRRFPGFALGFILLLCQILLLPAARADDDPRLLFAESLVVLFSGEEIEKPVPQARTEGKTIKLTSRQKEALAWKWSKDAEALEAAPTEPGLYTLTATCVRSGKTLLAPASLAVALLPPAESVVQVEAPLIHARLLSALDADRDGKITCREAAASLDVLDLSGLELTTAPEDLFRVLPRVKALNLSKNKLTSLPEGLTGLLSLEALDLSGNPIERLEAALPDSLKRLDVHACALDLDGTPESERIAALREKAVEVRSEDQAPRCVYLPIHLDPVTLNVGERYTDPGFHWQTIRGNGLRVTKQAPPDVETLLIAPDGSVSACRYDRLVFDAPGDYELCYTLEGSDVGSRRITVTGRPLATAPPAQEAVPGGPQVVAAPLEKADEANADASGMSRAWAAALLGLGCVAVFLAGLALIVKPKFARRIWRRKRRSP